MFRYGAALTVAGGAALLSGCSNAADTRALESLQNAKYPLWSHTELEVNKHQGSALVYAHTLHEKPKFYRGSMPLSYNGTETPGRGYTYGSPRMLKFEFPSFDCLFVYQGSHLLSGAVAVDRASKTLVAEAQLEYFVDKNTQGIRMKEFHYDSRGKLVFHCTSLLDPLTGFKVSESETLGKKERDYFFLMPGER